MSEEVEMTPITPEEGGAVPPKANPVADAVTSAPTVKLKPIIRKPAIRKPVIGGVKPVSLKPAAGVPPPPAAVPEAASSPEAPAAEPPPAPVPVANPVAAQAVLRKTGIVAEGILTPAQAQAAKTKTSRISLESAIGVAPVMKSAAPMKTIRLRRPTDIPGGPGTARPAPSALKPASPGPDAAAPAADAKPGAPAEAVTAATIAPQAAVPSAEAQPEKPADTTSSTVTQRKTLKLQRPGFKRPTVSGLRRPGDSSATTVQSAPGEASGDVADLPTVGDIPDIKTLPSDVFSQEEGSSTVAGAPAWLMTMTLLAGIAALVVVGLCTWTLFREAVGPAAGPNDLATFHSDTDYRR